MRTRCPGQDTRFWGPNDIYTVDCPNCGHKVEFFKDDIRRRCQKCGGLLLNPKLDTGCTAWCQYAVQCIGIRHKGEIKDSLSRAMREYFHRDEEKIRHSFEVLGFAEEILEKEKGNPKVVIPAAMLHDIGIHEADKKPERAEGSHREKEVLSIVRGILEKLGYEKDTSEEVGQVVEGCRTGAAMNTLNGKIVHDAAQLASFHEEYEVGNKERLRQILRNAFLTPTGRRMAEEIYLGI
jgi:Zn ribbon nucleic-acid-binding protein